MNYKVIDIQTRAVVDEWTDGGRLYLDSAVFALNGTWYLRLSERHVDDTIEVSVVQTSVLVRYVYVGRHSSGHRMMKKMPRIAAEEKSQIQKLDPHAKFGIHICRKCGNEGRTGEPCPYGCEPKADQPDDALEWARGKVKHGTVLTDQGDLESAGAEYLIAAEYFERAVSTRDEWTEVLQAQLKMNDEEQGLAYKWWKKYVTAKTEALEVMEGIVSHINKNFYGNPTTEGIMQMVRFAIKAYREGKT